MFERACETSTLRVGSEMRNRSGLHNLFSWDNYDMLRQPPVPSEGEDPAQTQGPAVRFACSRVVKVLDVRLQAHPGSQLSYIEQLHVGQVSFFARGLASHQT